MARGNIARRCNECRHQGKTGFALCNHKSAEYLVTWYIGNIRKRKTLRTKKEAEAFLHLKVNEDLLGISQPADIPFKDFTQEWLDNYAQNRVKSSTFRTYQNTMNVHLIPRLGQIRLKDISATKIDKFIHELSQSRSPKTVNNILILLKTILKYAKRRGYIRENPAGDVDNVRVEHQEKDFLNPDEIRLLLKHSREPFKTLFLTAALTGMRRGELLGLQWGDINWNSNTIFVRRSLYWRLLKEIAGDKPRFEFLSPKSERSKRAIIMSPALKEALELHRLTCPVSPQDLVFCTKTGSPIDPDHMVSRELLPSLIAAGLRRVNFHSLRHSYTSMLISQGENVKLIQSQLGHASIQMTLDCYGHLLPTNHIETGKKLDRQLLGLPEAVGRLEEAQASQNNNNQEQDRILVTIDNTNY